MIAIDTAKLFLSVVLVIMCFLPLNTTIIKNQNGIILIMLCITLLSLMFNDISLSLLLISMSVVFIYNVMNTKPSLNMKKIKEHMVNKLKQNNNSEDNKVQETPNKLPPIPPNPPVSNEIKPEISNSTNILNRHLKNMDKRLDKMQSNIFDKTNYSLFYNEIGDQHNIQGVETEISGFDSNMFMNG